MRARNPRRNLQIKFIRPIGKNNEFIAYIDAIGQLAGVRSVIDWKTSAARYPEQPDGLLALDPQLAAYSWITGEPEVAFVVFVRKRLPEVQHLRANISENQRNQLGRLLERSTGMAGGAKSVAHAVASKFITSDSVATEDVPMSLNVMG